MKRYQIGGILLIFLCLLAAGCQKKQEPGFQVYYLNSEKTALKKEGMELPEASTEKVIGQVLDRMRKPVDSTECVAAIPTDVEILEYQLEDAKLDLSFSHEYRSIDEVSEVLLRAAVVQTLTQIEGIDRVQFYVEKDPLMDHHGDVIGYQRSEDFVQMSGTALESYEQAQVVLYYADKTGEKLKGQTVTLRYNSYMTLERAIIRQLLRGEKDGSMQATIPPDTKLLSVSIKDDVCYVNVDKGFLKDLIGVDPEITIYALVNSLIAGGNCSQVQISVNGETSLSYHGKVELGKPFRANYEMVEK